MKYLIVTIFNFIATVWATQHNHDYVPLNILNNPVFQYLELQSPAQEHLTLSHFPVQETDSFVISSFIHKQESLTHVSLANSELSDQTCPMILASLCQHPELEYLDLSLNRLSKGSAIQLRILTEITKNIKYLDLHINHFSDDTLRHCVENLQRHNTIQYLNLSLNYLNSKVIDALCNLVTNCTSLHHLNLDYIGLSLDKRNDLLAALKRNINLKNLSLAYNNLKETGNEIGQLIKSCPALITLNLSHCELTLDDIRDIMTQLNLPKPKRSKSIFSSPSEIPTRYVTLKLEKSPANKTIAQFYQQHKPQELATEILFQLGSSWE